MATNVKKLTLYPDKDFDIIRLCELIAESDSVNFSELTTFAVEYYIQTGKYITIGHVMPKHYDRTTKIPPKNIYVRKGSLFEKWAGTNKNVPGFTLTNRVREILHASIQLTDELSKESVISLYEVTLELRKAKAVAEQPVHYAPIIETAPEIIEKKQLTQDTISSQPMADAGKRTEIRETKEPNNQKTQIRKESALNSMFLGGRKLHLDE